MRPLDDYYPSERPTKEKRARKYVQLTREEVRYVEALAKLWDALDEALDSKKSKRGWSEMAVLERLVRVGIEGAWGRVGGKPDLDKTGDLEALIKRAVAAAVAKNRK